MSEGIAILGAGAFGSALALALAPHQPVVLWGRSAPRWPDVATPPEALRVTTDLDDAMAAITLLSLPAQALRGFLADHGHRFGAASLISCAKGIDRDTLLGPSALIAAACPQATVAVLTGPSFAADIARGMPTALTLACADAEAGKALQHRLSTPVLRLYRSTDVTGAELGGALKNVIAIAAGVAIGAGFGDSARAAVITRGFAEMARLASHLGAAPETLTGLCGLGDLILTATSAQSRNFRYGLALGRGEGFDAAVTVEGRDTARAVVRLSQAAGIDMPVTEQIAALAEASTTVPHALGRLLARPLREE